METMNEIIQTITWPFTIIVIVVLLRRPLSQLVPTLKRLKYKEFVLDFEKEAQQVLAETERDIPENSKNKENSHESKSGDVQFCERFEEPFAGPAERILSVWRKIEFILRNIDNSEDSKIKSTGKILNELRNKNVLDTETYQALRSLATLRNKVAHVKSEVITDKTADSYVAAARRVFDNLRAIESNKTP